MDASHVTSLGAVSGRDVIRDAQSVVIFTIDDRNRFYRLCIHTMHVRRPIQYKSFNVFLLLKHRTKKKTTTNSVAYGDMEDQPCGYRPSG